MATARGCALARTLRVPEWCNVEVHAVPPSGDCFYDCLHYLLPTDIGEESSEAAQGSSPKVTGKCRENRSSSSSTAKLHSSSLPPCRRRKATLSTPQTMRNLVADRMDEDLFCLYSMFASAGVEDYAWMNHRTAPKNLEELKSHARVLGRDSGAGSCLWADEHAVRTLAEEARATILIVDEQATRRMAGTTRSGLRRKKTRGGGDDDGGGGARDGRFLAIGEHGDNCLLLLRSQRQHYNAVVVGGQRTFRIDDLPEATRELWPDVSCGDNDGNENGSEEDERFVGEGVGGSSISSPGPVKRRRRS